MATTRGRISATERGGPSPLQNRVDPSGALVATPARGLFMGNRGGRFHDPETRTLGKRRWASRQWICCRLDFHGRRRNVWGAGYTEIFFCDEVTALAAGHRPCFECRRQDARAFADAIVRGLGYSWALAAPDIDAILDSERRAGHAKRVTRLVAETLPDGAMILTDDGRFAALRGECALLWTPDGYRGALPRPTGVVDVLTPPASLAALRAGYRPLWSPTAEASGRNSAR